MDPSQAARLGWQMKAVFDESYLYIRIESSAELPAPGSTIEKPPGGWPVLKIDTSDAGEFVLYDAVNVGDQATFDARGRANSHRPFAAYIDPPGAQRSRSLLRFGRFASEPAGRGGGAGLRHPDSLGNDGHHGFARNQNDHRRRAVAKERSGEHRGPKVSALAA